MVRTPVLLRWKFRRGFEKIGFKNSEGETPCVLSCRRDKNKNHGIIYTFKNVGVSIDDFNNKVHQIQTVVNGIVYGSYYSMSQFLLSIFRKNIIIPKSFRLTILLMPRAKSSMRARLAAARVTLLVALGEYALHTNAIINICDYKKSTYSQFNGLHAFYGYSDVPDGIRAFTKNFASGSKPTTRNVTNKYGFTC